jgi:hypothetical protein
MSRRGVDHCQYYLFHTCTFISQPKKNTTNQLYERHIIETSICAVAVFFFAAAVAGLAAATVLINLLGFE